MDLVVLIASGIALATGVKVICLILEFVRRPPAPDTRSAEHHTAERPMSR